MFDKKRYAREWRRRNPDKIRGYNAKPENVAAREKWTRDNPEARRLVVTAIFWKVADCISARAWKRNPPTWVKLNSRRWNCPHCQRYWSGGTRKCYRCKRPGIDLLTKQQP